MAAVVVSYNRCSSLRVCIDSLQSQERKLDGIIVIDNGSSDSSAEMVEEFYPDVALEKIRTNLGGAGGFAYGISVALEMGYDHAWLMDDDAIALPASLGPLMEEMESRLPNSPGFVAATVIDENSTLLETHAPPPIPADMNCGLHIQAPAYGAPYCTFVGVLINLEIARKTWLPMADFFIWWDDTEYTARLQGIAGGMVSIGSPILHPREGSYGTDRLRFDVRNRVWVIRCAALGSRWSRMKAASTFVAHLSTQGRRRGFSYRRFIRPVLWGFVVGILHSPERIEAKETPKRVLELIVQSVGKRRRITWNS